MLKRLWEEIEFFFFMWGDLFKLIGVVIGIILFVWFIIHGFHLPSHGRYVSKGVYDYR